jgi:hypothetical protein
MGKRRFRTYSEDEQQAAYQKALNRGLDYLNTDLPQFKPIDGDNCIRILPPLEGDELVEAGQHPFGVECWVYFVDGSGYFVSPKAADKTAPDPLNDAQRELRKIDPDADMGISAGRKVICQVLDMNTDPENGEHKIWAAPGSLIDDMLNQAKDRRTGQTYSLEHPDKGYPVFFTKEGEMRKTKYKGVQLDREPYELDDAILDDMEFLTDVINIEDTETLEKVAAELLDSGKSGRGRGRGRGKDEDDDKPRRSRRSARGKDAEEEEEEDDPPPRRRRGRGKAEEEEESPRRGRGRGKPKDEEEEEEGEEEETKRRIQERLANKDGDDDGEGKQRFSRRRGKPKDEEEEEEEEAPRKSSRRRRR